MIAIKDNVITTDVAVLNINTSIVFECVFMYCKKVGYFVKDKKRAK